MSEKYIRICPCCREEITEDDNYVVCSVCRTPHHTECWLKTKHCSEEGCSGDSTSSGYGKTDSPFYINVGMEIVPEKSYDSEIALSDNSGIIEDFVTMALVERKAEYYLPKFTSMDKTNGKISFNLAACLFGWYWSIYRKLYIPAFILMASQLLVMNLPINPVFRYILAGLLFLTNGLIGNYLYKKRIYRCREEAIRLKEPNRSAYIATKGGVDMVLTIVMLVIFSVISVIRSYLPFFMAFFKIIQ